MKRALTLFCAVILALSMGAVATAQNNDLAFFMIDKVLGEAGYQGGSSVSPIGGGELVGVAVYVKNTDQLRGYDIDITWDSTKASWSASSGFNVPSQTVVINGAETVVAAETNALGSVMSLTDVNDPGHRAQAPALLGGAALVTSDFALIYYAELKTDASFTTDTALSIDIAVTAGNDGGVKKYLGVRTLYVNGGVDVKSSTWGEIKSQFKD